MHMDGQGGQDGFAQEKPLPHFRYAFTLALMVAVVLAVIACSSESEVSRTATPGLPVAAGVDGSGQAGSGVPPPPAPPPPACPPPVGESATETSAETDRAALEALFHATGGSDWTDNSNWLTARPLGEWHGVTTEDAGLVTKLDIFSNGVAGTLPPELGNLSRLERLSLSFNGLTGEIPPELGNLSNLQSLDLVNNRLEGPIPPALCNLSKLIYLDLSSNHLAGPLPTELGRLSRLIFLNLSENRLTGPIPPELGNLPNLTSLSLGNNELTGTIPPELGNLALLSDHSLMERQPEEVPDLFELDVSLDEEFLQTGVMPPELALLHLSFSALDLGGNNLTGEIPPELGNLVNLNFWLNLSFNNLSGPVPEELGNLVNLGWLMLNGNNLTGELDPSILTLPELYDLRFSDNAGLCGPSYLLGNSPIRFEGEECEAKRDGTGIPFFPPDLEVLEAFFHATGGAGWAENRNWLTDLPSWEWKGIGIDHRGRVTHLDASGNNLTGTIPPELGKLSELKVLDLKGNKLTGAIPPELASLSNLTSMDLSQNDLTGSIPPELSSLLNLTFLTVGDNNLSGEVPNSLAELTQLEGFEFLGNPGVCASTELLDRLRENGYASGPACEALASADSERDALIALFSATNGPHWTENENWLSDEPIDSWYGVSTDVDGRVSHIFLGNNKLTGTVPPELGKLAKLTHLDLSWNVLTGPIPRELGELTNLYYLDLSGIKFINDNITGPIPPELGNISNLAYLDLSNNDLTGSIPSELGNLSLLIHLSLHGNELEGIIPPELTGLSNLEYLSLPFYDLSLCVTPAMGDWFHDIGRASGPACPTSPLSPGVGADWEGLAALYNSTDGPEWIYTRDWFTEKPMEEWSGVTTDEEGRVIHLNRQGSLLFGGVLPPELGRLSRLEILDLSGNNLWGPIPSELGNLSNLEVLDLAGNKLSGRVPPELGNLSNLSDLDLSHNELRGAIPFSLTNLERLNAVDFRSNGSGLCAPPSLQDWLWGIPNPRNKGPICIPHSTAADSDRAALVAFYNATGGPHWRDNKNWLTDVPIGSWYGVTVDSTGRVSELQLYANWLTGTIPRELGNLSKLTSLDLSNDLGPDSRSDNLVGPIPPELGNLSNLTYLDLRNNDLTGGIPPELGNLSKLTSLILEGNEFTGNIPPELGNLSELSGLYFERNAGLCSPHSLQEWRSELRYAFGPTCPEP